MIRVAAADNKFDLGDPTLSLQGKTLWAYLFAEFMILMHLMGTDQTNVQRYAAAASDKAAARGAWIGCWLSVPTWSYYLFLGTCLYVYVKVVPGTGLEGLPPDAVFPRFILTAVPAGVGGFVLSGLLASAMSTLDSSINATAATVTNDFYRRLWVKGQGPDPLRQGGEAGEPAVQPGDDHHRLRHPLLPGVRDPGRPAANAAVGHGRGVAQPVPGRFRDSPGQQPGGL